MRRRWIAQVCAVVGAFVAVAASAAPVRIFRTQSAEAFGKGEADAVSVDSAGVVALAPAAEKIATIEEPFAFALAPRGHGWAVGTGNEGRVLAIDENGKVSVAFDADEPEIFALTAGGDGRLFAGSSPNGKLYAIDGAKSEVWFDPAETYIWAVVPGGDDTLWVAVGSPGKLYRVTAKDKAEMVWEGATHVRSLLALPNGDLLFGTAGDGRLLRWHAGKVRTLYDSELTEIASLAAASDGSVWIATLSSESSFVDLSARPGAESEESKGTTGGDDDAGAGSRPAGTQGARSELLRLAPSGSIESVWSSSDETLFALLPDGDGVWAATGLDGNLYRIERGRARVERKLDAKQLVGLAAPGPAVLTTNGAALWRLMSRRETKGTYTSAVLDALQLSRFGVFRWQGTSVAGAPVRVSFRTGFASEPDATWSDWSAPAALEAGRDLALDAIERGRFVQYRLELESGANGGARIATTELSYRQENLRPTIQSFAAMDPGQILVSAGFNPSDQLYEPASPNREGIFDSLRATPPRGDRQKTVWRKGWLTLRWEIADPNGDALESKLEVRPEGDADGWLELGDEIDETQWAFDATALPDGLYRFRLTTSDAPGNEPSGAALESTRESEPVVIDQTPPEVAQVARHGTTISARVTDRWSPLREAEASIDGGDWRPARVVDGLLDGRAEALEVADVPAGARLVLLRAIDSAWNVRTFDLVGEARVSEARR